MRLVALIAFLFALVPPAEAAPDWRQSREYEILLSSYDIQPETMHFRAGEPLRLRLINNSNETHVFAARQFFGSSDVRPRERKLLSGGAVKVAPGETLEIVLVPRSGRYRAGSTSLFSRLMGMRARILVD